MGHDKFINILQLYTLCVRALFLFAFLALNFLARFCDEITLLCFTHVYWSFYHNYFVSVLMRILKMLHDIYFILFFSIN